MYEQGRTSTKGTDLGVEPALVKFSSEKKYVVQLDFNGTHRSDAIHTDT